ncbi:SDR family oxidoreductase [Fictibacillus enclensis]|uniref:SDR family oxidoreductase n=1 Tax=Fictibacillus enclensis TaxID=1017270 RepID=UPI0025A2535D|nr:SDR family oxidoreductase [Fictibacillus enclensis]MDM5197188.1 SDR family oxidoreductase [Fictibacillus enclensis]
MDQDQHRYPTDTPPEQQNRLPGIEENMYLRPQFDRAEYKGSGKLKDKVALITGGDSGIGRAVASLYAKEGAHVAIVYYDEHRDAEFTKEEVEKEGVECLLIPGDLRKEAFAKEAVQKTIEKFGKLDILVSNAATAILKDQIEDVHCEDFVTTFETNVFGAFYITKEAVPHLKEGSTIIFTTSDSAYKGQKNGLDYASSKAAVLGFMRSLSLQLVDRGIRVNGISPGPIWTPLIPASQSKSTVDTFGQETPMKRVGQPEELAPGYVLLASEDSTYMSGQVIHINGGTVVNG